jgi:Ni,Fe-hydrogenase III small subunit/ferredoxin-like protein FixX
MLQEIKILFHQGSQYIRDVRNVEVPGIFKGRPVISTKPCDEDALSNLCPTGAISTSPVCIDLGKCVFCGACSFAFPEKISFTKDYHLAVNNRENLLIKEGEDKRLCVDDALVRKEIRKLFKGSFKLRQVCAGGDNSTELELNASGNVQFDAGRFGFEFVASPRHADALLITGPITSSMAEPLDICYRDMSSPKAIILCGTDAISGGIFEGSPALDRSFLDEHTVDLYIPGNPTHPLTFINGILDLLGRK